MKLSPWWDAVTQPPVQAGEYEFRRSGAETSNKRLWIHGQWHCAWPNDPVPFPAKPGDKWRGVLREEA